MAKFEIGFYSFYQIFDSFDKSNQTEIANTLKITGNGKYAVKVT